MKLSKIMLQLEIILSNSMLRGVVTARSEKMTHSAMPEYNYHSPDRKQKVKLNSIIFLCEFQRLEPAWNELANTLSYDPSVSISRIDCTQHRPICQDFEVKGYPTLLWIVDGKKEEKYSGSRSVEAFKEFIEQKTASERKHAIDEEEAKVQEIAVLQLTGNSFNHGVEKGVTIVSGQFDCQIGTSVKLHILIDSNLFISGEILCSMVWPL